MKTISLNISDSDYKLLGLDSQQIDFKDLKKFIYKVNFLSALKKCQKVAKESGLAEMTMEEINEEVRAVRENA